jgi:hypothetical protein
MLAGSFLGLVVLGRVAGELGAEVAVFVDDAHVGDAWSRRSRV